MSRYMNVGQKISVNASFPEVGQPMIHSFAWDGNNYEVKEMHMVNALSRGRDTMYMFSVATPRGAYKLRLDVATLHWWLEEVYWEE